MHMESKHLPTYSNILTAFFFFKKTDADIKVMCSSDYIGIRVMEDFFKYHNVPLESLHLPNKTCRAQKTSINGVTYYTSRISKDEYLTCGGEPLEVQLKHWAKNEPVKKGTHLSFVFCFFSFLPRRKTLLTSHIPWACCRSLRLLETLSEIQSSSWIINVSLHTSGESACHSQSSPIPRKDVELKDLATMYWNCCFNVFQAVPKSRCLVFDLPQWDGDASGWTGCNDTDDVVHWPNLHQGLQ